MQETKVVIRITPTETTIEVTGPPNVIAVKTGPGDDYGTGMVAAAGKVTADRMEKDLASPFWQGFPATGPAPKPDDQPSIAVETTANGVDGSDVPGKPTYRLTQESFDEKPAIFYTVAMNEKLSSLPPVWKSPHPLDEGYDIGVKRSDGIDWYEAVIDPDANDIPF